MLDIGHDFKQIDPNWFDTMRVTKLPSFDGPVRRGRQHVRRRAPEPPRRQVVDARPTLGELKTTFEFELFGTGVDAGQTTFRLRHA